MAMTNIDLTAPESISGGFATTAEMYQGAERQAARDKNGATLLPPALEGELISRLPAAHFGFTYSPASPETGLFTKPAYLGYEVHRASSGSVEILGFTNAEEAAKFRAGKEVVILNLYPVGTNEATEFIVVPQSRIVRSKSLDRAHFNRLTITVDPG